MSEGQDTMRKRTSSGSKPRSPSRGTRQPPWADNAIRQLKLIIPGAAITYYMGTIDKLSAMLQAKDSSWCSIIALAALGNAVVMVALFLYILTLIHLRGENPDWRTWRQSGSLATTIPALTTTIILGWLLHVIALGQWSGLGYARGFVASGALYALIFGLLALIPSPKPGKLH